MTRRPSKYDKSIVEEAVESIIPKVAEWMFNSGDVLDEDSKQDLIEAIRSGFGDGYESASYLEQNCYWEPDSELVYILDDIYFCSRKAEDKAIRKWVKEEGIQVPFEKGQQIKFKYEGKTWDGEIVEVDNDLARVLVYVKDKGHVKSGDGTYGLFFDVEDLIEKLVK